jgi:hypothetical protein
MSKGIVPQNETYPKAADRTIKPDAYSHWTGDMFDEDWSEEESLGSRSKKHS